MFKTLKDFSVNNTRVLVRCDFDVPVDEKGNILDDFRIKQALPTIKYLIEQKAKVILMGHLGRPGGKVVPELKLDKVAEKLAEYLNISIEKEDDCIGPDAETESNKLAPGKVLVLENLRFHKEEEGNDPGFAKSLSYLGDIYVNNAFANSHRNHASMTGVCKYLPSAVGLTLQKEIEVLDNLMKSPEKPLVVLIGGAKVEETKLKLVENFSTIAVAIIISGLIKKGIIDKKIEFKHPEKIVSPVGDLGALDINEESIKIICEKIVSAKTVLWNGPFGKFEDKDYAKGTLAIANAIIKSGSFSVVGGGETVEFINKQGMIDKFSHVSTGGGAMLSYLSGDSLPGIEALG